MITPPQRLSPRTNPRVGCGVRVHRLGFPLSDSASITRAEAVLTETRACSHTHSLKKSHASFREMPTWVWTRQQGSKFLSRERSLSSFHLCYSFQGPFAPNKVFSLTKKRKKTSAFQLKVNGICIFPGGVERDDTDTQSFLSLIFLFLFSLSLCRSEQRGGMSVCSVPGALTAIRFRSERSCEKEERIEPKRGWEGKTQRRENKDA